LRRVRKGEVLPQATLDLHGRRKNEALNDLDGFLRENQKLGHDVVRIVTGRGLHSADLGVLREMVPVLLRRRWPNAVREVIPAPAALGGEGALVVLLRRKET